MFHILYPLPRFRFFSFAESLCFSCLPLMAFSHQPAMRSAGFCLWRFYAFSLFHNCNPVGCRLVTMYSIAKHSDLLFAWERTVNQGVSDSSNKRDVTIFTSFFKMDKMPGFIHFSRAAWKLTKNSEIANRFVSKLRDLVG